jgi:hypothetical protein
MDRKAAEEPHKTTVNPRKTIMNPRISGSCYKSFGQNGGVFRRNSPPRKDLELPQGGAEFMCNPGKHLRPILTDGPRQSIHKTLLDNNFGLSHQISSETHVRTKYNHPHTHAKRTARAAK